MRIFYLAELNKSENSYFLSEEESKHIVRVLRLNLGDSISVMNGKGLSATAEIASNNPKKCLINVNEFHLEEKPVYDIHVSISPTKSSDKMEWLVEKLTEIGVGKISFVLSQNSERKVLKLDRLNKIMISAAKQCKRSYFPILEEMIPFNKFIINNPEGYIAHCTEEGTEILTKISETNSATILIGPEGDFTLEEVQFAMKNGYKSISLGNNRLRTETAALVAVTILISKQWK